MFSFFLKISLGTLVGALSGAICLTVSDFARHTGGFQLDQDSLSMGLVFGGVLGFFLICGFMIIVPSASIWRMLLFPAIPGTIFSSVTAVNYGYLDIAGAGVLGAIIGTLILAWIETRGLRKEVDNHD